MPTKSQILDTDPHKVLDLIDGWKATVVADQIRDAESAVGKNLKPDHNRPHIQLVDRHTPLPQDPAPVPTDPRMVTEQAWVDYDQLEIQILGHNANRPRSTMRARSIPTFKMLMH